MKFLQKLFILCLILPTPHAFSQHQIIRGDEQTDQYFPQLKNKSVGIVANQTSMIGSCHLVDSLLKAGFAISKIFCPEHGFRGDQEAGEKVENYKDKKTGLTVISLYGKNKKPKPSDLKNIDVMVFDIQDVGVRFYTYLSTLHYVMEACAENNVSLILLDRPNPNGFYIDGPVLEMKYKSFAGLHPVPVVYGMTIGEYAQMINGEKWLKNGAKCNLNVITCKNYTHDSLCSLAEKPSPNLPIMRSVYLYPSLALFEGTYINVGRRTDFPFQAFGHPKMQDCPFIYSIKNKKETITYHGMDLRPIPIDSIISTGFTLQYLIYAYQHSPEKETFFNLYFLNLSGSSTLQSQIKLGKPENEIRKSWQPALDEFKIIRKKYLLYPDFGE
jgi:uncharacterized protein YbbC (DUF1343 family)